MNSNALHETPETDIDAAPATVPEQDELPPPAPEQEDLPPPSQVQEELAPPVTDTIDHVTEEVATEPPVMPDSDEDDCELRPSKHFHLTVQIFLQKFQDSPDFSKWIIYCLQIFPARDLAPLSTKIYIY